MSDCVHEAIKVQLKRMDLDIMQSKDWVSIIDPVLGIGGAGKDYAEAFAAFGRSLRSYELCQQQVIVQQEPPSLYDSAFHERCKRIVHESSKRVSKLTPSQRCELSRIVRMDVDSKPKKEGK